MDRANHHDDPELLLDQTAWVKGLARSLAVDASGAEDVAQEAMLAALQSSAHPPGDPARLRAWLAKVVANLSNLRVRRDSRRRVREQWVARAEPTPSVADTLSRAGQMRLVVDEVMDLAEPYRSTVLLRYFDGLPTRQIAESMDCTPEAVRKRLSRAHGMLRDRLDRKHGGDGSSWLAALAPLIGELPTPPAPLTELAQPAGGSATFASPTVAVGVASAAGIVALGVFGIGALRGAQPSLAAEATPLEAHLVQGAVATPTGASASRVALAAGEASEVPGSTDEPGATDWIGQVVVIDVPDAPPIRPLPSLAGTVYDLDASPVAGLDIRRSDRAGERVAYSSPEGEFHMVLTGPRATLVARSEDTFEGARYATVRAALVDDVALEAEPIIVVGPAVDLAGRVVDDLGMPLPDAQLTLVESDSFLHGFPWPLQRTEPIERRLHTDEGGFFRAESWVSATGLALRVEVPGYEPLEMPVPAVSRDDLEITLVRGPLEYLHGVVLHDDGQPAPHALVRFGAYATRSDAQGLFRLEYRRVAPETALRATRPGFADAVIASFGAHLAIADRAGESTGAVRMVLGGPALTLAGHVQDRTGRPLEGWEAFAVPAGLDEGQDEEDRVAVSRALTAPDGGFLLKGLEDREYVVHAVDRSTLLTLRSETVRPGGEGAVRLELPEQPFRNVDGRVTTPNGMPLADALVTVVLDCSQLSCEAPLVYGRTTRTDGRGAFSLPAIPVTPVELRIQHAEASATLLPLELSHGEPSIEIEVPRDRFVQVSSEGGQDMTIRIAGPQGEWLDMYDSRRELRRRAALRDGRSSVLRVSEEAHEVVVFEDGVEVSRHVVGTRRRGVSRIRVQAPVHGNRP